jgi:hypothetical protein
MKILIWVNKNDVLANKILAYHFTRPIIDRHDEYLQVEITQDEFVRLEDNKQFDTNHKFSEYTNEPAPYIYERYGKEIYRRTAGETNRELLTDSSIDQTTQQLVTELQTIRGADFENWWKNLTKEEQIKLTKFWE